MQDDLRQLMRLGLVLSLSDKLDVSWREEEIHYVHTASKGL